MWAELCYYSGRLFAECGVLPLAAACFRAAIAHSPRHTLAREYMAWAETQLAHWPEALVAYDGVLALTPNLASAHFGRSIALQQLNRHEEAIVALRSALDLGLTDPAAHYNLGVSLAACGRHHEALFAYRRAVADQPTNAKAMENLAITLSALGEFEEAVSWHERSWNLAHAAGTARNLGITLAELDRYGDAATWFREAMRHTVSTDLRQDVTIRLALCLAEQGNFSEATLLLKDLADSGCDDSYTGVAEAMVLLLQDRPQEALAAATTAAEASPENSQAQAARGWSHLAMGDGISASAAFEQALRLDDRNLEYRLGRACALSSAQRYSEALSDFEVVLTEQPRMLKRSERYQQFYDRARRAVAEPQS